jgi:hypothetical protein
MTLIYLLIGISFSFGSLFMTAFVWEYESSPIEGQVKPAKRNSGFQNLSINKGVRAKQAKGLGSII